MKVCPKCNTEYPDDGNFCPHDATKLVDKATTVGSAVPVRGWTQAISQIDRQELLKKGKEQAEKKDALVPEKKEPATAKPAGMDVPLRGWTQAFSEADREELLKRGKEAANKDALLPKAKEAAKETPKPAAAEVPVHGWTAAFSAIDATEMVKKGRADDDHNRPTMNMSAVDAATLAKLDPLLPAKKPTAPEPEPPTIEVVTQPEATPQPEVTPQPEATPQPAPAVAEPLPAEPAPSTREMAAAVQGSRIGLVIAGVVVGVLVMVIAVYFFAMR